MAQHGYEVEGGVYVAGRRSEVACEHDWRVNPNIVLTSYPPQQQLVCADCGARSSRVMPGFKMPSRDPKDWPRA